MVSSAMVPLILCANVPGMGTDLHALLLLLLLRRLVRV